MADTSSDDLLAVIAHSLLSSMTVIQGSSEVLDQHWAELPEPTRRRLLDRIVTQAAHVSGVLTDLVRLGDPELVRALEELDDSRDRPLGSRPEG